MRQQIEAEQARQREIANAVVQLDEADDREARDERGEIGDRLTFGRSARHSNAFSVSVNPRGVCGIRQGLATGFEKLDCKSGTASACAP